MIKKAVNAKAKLKLRPNSNLCEKDQYYACGGRNINKINILSSQIKEVKIKKFMSKLQ